MSRPIKNGLEYFSFDIDFFEDEKIEAISGEFGIKGELAAIKLLCAIYRNGYFAMWDDLLKMKILNRLPGVSSELLDQIVLRLVKWGFFDETLFNSEKVLTSNGIQKRFLEATKRRSGSAITVYACNNGVNVNKNPLSAGINVCNNPQSKVKESKVKGNTDPRHDLKESNLFRQPKIPTVEKVKEVFMNQSGTEEMALKFFETNSATGWFYRGSPIVNFSSLVPGFIQAWNKNGNSDNRLEGVTEKQMKMRAAY